MFTETWKTAVTRTAGSRILSSKSLRYLVSPKVKSYKEKKFTGPMAQHSRLRENPQVLKTAISFPWPNI
ncbi:hypothetical protein BTJ18_07170 [Lactobacillus delbrueckii subsp. bulgaricus]|nr:hypothetical protein [Lactobacillus delbrueckii subsp. bulgaricus]